MDSLSEPVVWCFQLLQRAPAESKYLYFQCDKVELIIGLFLFSVSTLDNAAKIQGTSMAKWLLIQTAFYLLQFVVAGVLLGLVNRQKQGSV